MLVPILFIVAFLAALTGAVLENSFARAKLALDDAVSGYLDAAMSDGVADFSQGLAGFVAEHGTGGPWPSAASRSAPRSACASTQPAPCPFRYVISATITAASGNAAPDRAGETDGAVNLQATAIGEQRVSAIVTAGVSGPDGAVIGARSRFLTYRVFAAPPYALASGSRDVSTVEGARSAAQGDSGGAQPPDAAGSPPGGTFADTRIHVRLTCQTVIEHVVPFTNDQQPAGNDGLPWGNAAQAAYEAPCTTADAPADAFYDERWSNGDANRSGWTQ